MRDEGPPARWRAWAWLLPIAATGSCGCPSFATAMSEFDSVAGWQPAQPEPDVVAYSENAERLPLPIRVLEGSGLDIALTGLFGIEPASSKISRPSAFARERMLCFSEAAIGDVHRAALAIARLSWVLDGDAHALNQITALHGLHLLCRHLDLDPLRQELGPIGEQSEEAVVVAWQPHVAALRSAVTEIAAGSPLQAATATACATALSVVPLQVPPSPRDRRVQMLLLNYLAHRSPDRDLGAAARVALEVVKRRLAADSLRRALYEPRSPLVRDAAVRVCCALGDDSAVARVLRMLTTMRAPTRGAPGTLQLDRTVRLTLVRLCGQLPEQVAVRAEPGGPAPVEFLFDVISDSNADQALAMAALEALACCLGRPARMDRGWADEWWQDYVVRRGGQS